MELGHIPALLSEMKPSLNSLFPGGGVAELFTHKIPLNWYQVFKRGQMLWCSFAWFHFHPAFEYYI